MQNKIIIWGRDNYNTLGLLRQLSGDGRDIFFLMLGKPIGCASASRYFKHHVITNSIEEGFNYLLSYFSQEKLKPVIFTPSDEIIEFIDKNKPIFEQCYIIPGTQEQGLLTKIDDKNTMTELASKLGFLVPWSCICHWDSDISQVQYPCILKPAHTTVGHHNEFKFKICYNLKNLRRALTFVRKDSDFILQQYINKENDVLVYGCRLKSGKVIIGGSILRDRFCRTGETSHGLITKRLPKGISKEQIELFLSTIDYHGLFSFEYGLYEDKAFFFEVNLRNDGTSHFFYQAGANIPLTWYYDAIGKDFGDIPTEVDDDIWYIDEIYDIVNVLNGTLSLRKWIHDKAQAKVFKYYSPDDPAPWKHMKRWRIKNILQDTIVKKYRLYIVWIMDKLKR